ncbi:MAG: hypothetical protein MI749_21125, partial [Desulfovibrionales bacterium]|nr:hypothetical protein [Desulfovibrionales bacterium]
MYTVSEPSELTSAFLNIAASILSLGRSGSSLSVNGGNLTTNTVFYQSTYSTEDWTGDVKAYGINAVTGDVNTNYEWSASEELADDLSILGWWSSGSGRKIFTTNGRIGVPFNRSRQSTIGISTDLINYIRGDDSREGEEITDFRERNQPLGDIVSSSPIHVNNAIFVGANDGMLHAFSSATGKEIFAYVPKAVVPNLEGLAERDYVHNYFVDRTPYAKRIDENSTYLVGGLGKGGKAYYCLDISLSNLTPSSEARAASTIFQWEFPRTVDDDLGYTYSQAYIVKTTVGWVVIFGNGYESVNSKAVLYVVRLSDGHLLKKIDTQYGGSTANCNGLSSPALIDVDADGIVDYAYAGDIRGNMWKFDLRDENVSNWKVAFQDAANIPQPLFRAMNKNGHAQAIMAKPDVILSCDRGKLGYMVIFGTGKLLGKIDVSNGSTQSLYGIWDWSDEWAQNGKNAAERKAEDKYLGSFQTARDGTRTFSNLSSLAYL